jgi:hypothetical protein
MVKCFCAAVIFLLFLWEKSTAQIEKDTISIPRTPFLLEHYNDADQTSDITIANIGEDIYGQQLQFLTDDIERMLSAPIHLQTASWRDLQAIPTLTDLDIYHILQYRKNGSPLSADILSRSRHYITTQTSVSPEPVFSIRTRVEIDPSAYKEAVYQNGTYEGSPLKTSTRITAKTDDIFFSVTEAKNSGEPLYFDHVTGCLGIVKPISITEDVSVSQCVLGDYSLSFGNGLLFTGGYSQLPSSEVNASLEPRSSGIKPYISSSTYRYFQGAGAELTSGMFSAAGFFSDKKIDATVDTNGITSLTPSAYHRTSLELARKNQAESKVAGGHIAITPIDDDTYLEFGATAYALNYDKPVIAQDSFASGFTGQRHAMISGETRGAFSILSWSAEYAGMISDAGRANAFAISAIAAPFTIWEISLNYHELPSNFISPFGGTFGIKANTAQNEKGWYLGSKLFLIPNRLSLFGSANISKSRGTSGDTLYSDIRLGSKYILPSIPLRLSVELRSYGRGAVFDLANDTLSKNSLRFDADCDIAKTINLSLRAEFQNSPSKQNGNLLGVAIKYLPLEELSIASGVTFFQTDSYAARLYPSIPTLPGSASLSAMYGKNGYTFHTQFSYDVTEAITVSARITQTNSTPVSGNAPVHKTIFGAQCDLAF